MRSKKGLAVIAAAIVLTMAGWGHEHEFGDWEIQKEATCTEAGLKIRTCNCKEEESEEIPAIGHTYGEGKVLSEATCTTPGELEYTCTVCGQSEKKPSDALGHQWAEEHWCLTPLG